MTQPWQGAATPRHLGPADFARAAGRLRCEPAALRAIWEVEAAGKHFRPDATPTRRFEPHHFPRAHWPALGFQPRAGEAPWRAALRLSSDAMFLRAARIDAEAAMRAASWGAPQIMGFNARDAGFASAGAMVRAMARGAPQQLDAFVRLVEAWGLAPAIRANDWQAFARRYNGSGQVEVYARRIEAAFRRHTGRASPLVLRVGDRGPAVRTLQTALGIEDDGAFGPETLAAVLRFQASAGLAADGVVGARTWAALKATPPTADAPPPAPVPPLQPTPADALLDRVTAWSGVGAAVSAAVTGLREALPEAALTAMIAVAAAMAVIAMTAWAVRWARA